MQEVTDSLKRLSQTGTVCDKTCLASEKESEKMNETRDLIIGIDFGKEYSQICYYDRKADEPRSLPVKVGSSQFEMPTCLCRRPDRKTLLCGIWKQNILQEKKVDFSLGNLYEISAQNGPSSGWSVKNKRKHGSFLHIICMRC